MINIGTLMFFSAAPLAIGVGIGALALGAVLGIVVKKALEKRQIENSKLQAAKIIEQAETEAKTLKKEAILEAKEEIQTLKETADKEIFTRRTELQKTEDRLLQREQHLDNKEQNLDKKSEQLEQQKQSVQDIKQNLQKEIELQKEERAKIVLELERVAKITSEEAKQILMTSLTDEARKSAFKEIKRIEEETKEKADQIAQNLVSMAIQKCATDVTSEATVSVVAIPNDEMKGRIIGREGRNIRSIENAMGVDLIVDDTPEAITISCFDPVRREIARLSLEKLIMDGRIHPTRIEEIVNKVTKDVEHTIKQAGENASEEAGVFGLHPELVKTLGKLKYRTSYGQNCLKHSLETAYIAGMLASELGADVKVAKRGGLLHDIDKALDHEVEGTHVSIGVELAKKYKENQAVVHCIEAHHFGVEFASVEAVLVQVADSISSSRPGARRETLENYVKRLQKLEEISNSYTGVEKSFAIQAGREIRILVKPTEITDEEAHFLAEDIAKRIENEMEYPGQIKVNVIRETRFSATAK